MIVLVVFYLTARLFLLRRRRGGAIRGFGRGGSHLEEEISIEQLRVFWIWKFWRWRRTGTNTRAVKRDGGHVEVHRKRWRDIWDREINGC